MVCRDIRASASVSVEAFALWLRHLETWLVSLHNEQIILLNLVMESGALWGALPQTGLLKYPNSGQTSETSFLNGYYLAPTGCPTHYKFLVWTTLAEARMSLGISNLLRAYSYQVQFSMYVL